MVSNNRCILLIVLLYAGVLHGQFDKLQNYNVKDGLASSEVYGVMQDSKGFMWFCGDMGVNRFNGYEFKNFTIENGLADNVVFGMFEDKKNRIWFRPYSNRLSFYENGKINVLPCNATIEKILNNDFTVSIFIDAGDTIWLGTTKNFVLKIAPGWKAKDVTKILLNEGKYFFMIDDGLVFGGSSPQNCKVSGYKKNLKKILSIDPLIENKTKGYLRFHFLKLDENRYIASIGAKLFMFNSKGIIQERQENEVISFIKEDENSIILNTYNNASFYSLNKFKKEKEISELSGKVVTGSCIDKEKGLWFTTEGQGVYYLPHRNFSYYTSQNKISESKISCIGIYNSNVTIGHLDGLLDILYEDSVYSISTDVKVNKVNFPSRVVNIFNYGDQALVVNMKNVFYLKDNVLKIEPKFKELRKLSIETDLGLRKFVSCKDSNIWALHYGRLVKYNRRTFDILDTIKFALRTDNFFEDSKGKIWLSSINGVNTYVNNKISYLGNKNKLFSLRSAEIGEAIDKSIWIATRGGGIVIKKNNTITQLNEKNGLAGNMCRCLFVDSNIVWVGTNKGLSKITITNEGKYTIENLYARNGLLTNEVNSILKHNKKLWLAHNNGVSVFNVAAARSNTFAPPVYIEQTFVGDSLCRKEDLLNLKYDQNYITVNYIGLSYKEAGNIEYKYKMEGIDSNWIYTRYTTVNYHTVPPGSYRFLVLAKNNDGYWSPAPAVISFKILPPWWQTWFFISFVTIVIGLLIGFVLKYWLSIIKHRERLRSIQQTKLSNAELKALRAQMNPHFVFNAINSVQYFITSNDPASSQKYLSKFAKLIRYVVDNSKPSVIPLNKELEALNLYLDLETLRFEHKFEYIIDINVNVDVNNIKIPSMLIQPYVENAIWHGLMHKGAKGHIRIEIKKSDNILICFIEDNGIGRKKAAQILKEKNSEFHRSVGMSLTQERLDIISQQNNTKLIVAIIDLEDAEGCPTGTRVELNLPFY